ncbi:MAG: response regulator [Gammaproteobacteria bacterium]|nr:response regulator [Gammaproteobacteria bacterium]MDH5802622.1 response regulator [Gammaproteobacteria bacterium]
MFKISSDPYAPPLYGNVLIIENDPIQQQIIHLLLRKIGLTTEVIFADERTLECMDKRHFDAVIIDSIMQFVDATKLIETLRKEEFTKPIVVLVHDESSDGELFLDAGCDAICNKPVDQTVLYNALKPYLACNSPAGRNSPIRSNLLDKKPQMAEEVKGFVSSLPAKLNLIRKLFKTEQWLELLEVAKDINGNSFGYPSLENYSRVLQYQIRVNDLKNAQFTIKDLQFVCQRIYLGLHQ